MVAKFSTQHFYVHRAQPRQPRTRREKLIASTGDTCSMVCLVSPKKFRIQLWGTPVLTFKLNKKMCQFGLRMEFKTLSLDEPKKDAVKEKLDSCGPGPIQHNGSKSKSPNNKAVVTLSCLFNSCWFQYIFVYHIKH